jgi:hypothetical protein
MRPYIPLMIPFDMQNPFLILIYEQTTTDMDNLDSLQAVLTTDFEPRTTWKLADYTGGDGLTGEWTGHALIQYSLVTTM